MRFLSGILILLVVSGLTAEPVSDDSLSVYRQKLQEAISSVRLSYYIKSKDDANIRKELSKVISNDKVETFMNWFHNEPYQPLTEQPFFVALGECQSVDQAQRFIDLKNVDVALVPVYEFEDNIDKIMKVIKNSDKQVSLAFDFELKYFELMRFIERWANEINSVNEPVIHSVVALWRQNVSNISTKQQYEEILNEYFENAENIVRSVKTISPNIYVYRRISFIPGNDKAWDRIGNIRCDGYWWLSPHYLYYRRLSDDKPIIISAVFGKGEPLKNSKNDVENHIDYAKNQKANGICFIGFDGWIDALH